MAKHYTPKPRRAWYRVVLAVTFSAGVLGITGSGVFAGLNAIATGTATVSSGELSLTMTADSTSVGFPETISNMAPGDVVNNYVVVSNGPTMAGQALTLSVTGSTSNTLTTSATKGVAVAITQCSVAWTVGTGTCSGTTTTLLASTPVATLSGTPGSLVAGAVATSASYHLQVSTSLPSQSETTTNGTPPGGTVQGLSNTLTYTFNEVQRSATTTNQ